MSILRRLFGGKPKKKTRTKRKRMVEPLPMQFRLTQAQKDEERILNGMLYANIGTPPTLKEWLNAVADSIAEREPPRIPVPEIARVLVANWHAYDKGGGREELIPPERYARQGRLITRLANIARGGKKT